MCCIGDSGIGVPTMSPSLGAQIPTAETTRSVSMSPWVVWTAVTRPPEILKPVTSTLPKNDAPFRSASLAIASAGLVAFVWISEGT